MTTAISTKPRNTLSTETTTANPTEPAWTDSRLENPHVDPDKAERVEQMFAAIAPSYDLNNRVHSLGRDQAWRKTAVKMATLKPTDRVLDVACGTGDLTFAFASALNKLQDKDVKAETVVGADFTEPMLDVARSKQPSSLDTDFQFGDATALEFADASFDVVSIAFGIRNVSDPRKALGEFYRVLRPGGRLIVLEFTVPGNPLMRLMNNFYCGWVMPKTATLISGDKSGAYKYLPRSVSTFTGKTELIDAMQVTGFADVTAKTLSFGIAACYRGVKPD
ncbi:MAG: bifunctional demethylmenaquinone methyltransferase/2-methoxy-6-polyprenyl-1,4-benzoquinol methylase UbiE [Planctomycetota bacterium]